MLGFTYCLFILIQSEQDVLMSLPIYQVLATSYAFRRENLGSKSVFLSIVFRNLNVKNLNIELQSRA